MKTKFKLSNRILSLVLALVMVLACMPGRAYAAESASGTTGDCTWTFDSETGIFTVSGNGAMEGYNSSSDRPWYSISASVTSLVIEEGVTEIGKNAFSFCRNIKSVVIPASVEVISNCAFLVCPALETVTFAEGSKLTTIGDSAFSLCDSLEQITIPAGVTDIYTGSGRAFYGCVAMKNIFVEEGNLKYEDIDGVLYYTDLSGNKYLVYYPAGREETSFTTPEGVTSISDSAFLEAKALKTVTLSEGIQSVDSRAFEFCTGLTEVFLPKSLTRLHYRAFHNCNNPQVHYCDTAEVFNSNVTIVGGTALEEATLVYRADENKDHICDTCGNGTPCVDTDSNGMCDVCGEHCVPEFKIEDNKLYVSYDGGYSWEEIGNVADGKSVESIEKTATNGNVDTYTITYSDGTTSTFTVTNGKDGADGITPQFKVENSILYVSYDEGQTWTSLGSLKGDKGDQGEQGEQGDKGETGNGIAKIEKTSTNGLVDTYTITYTDGTTTTFTVTNGAQGIQGIQGEKGDKGDAPVITIQNGNWYIDGVDTGVAATGIKGDTGNGISDISKTKTEGLVDTYTITYTDGTTTTFTVTNGEKGEQGEQGEQGIQGIQGVPGKDGHTPVITIVDGYWYIDGVNTGVAATGIKGDKGDTGNGIAKIEKTSSDGLVDTYTITYTDGTTTTFTVTNGAQGVQGTQGVPGKDGHTPVITIQNGNWFVDGVDTGVAATGIKGETGNGIASIKKTGIDGLVDTYTITYTDGTTTTFTVTNGEKGEQGEQGIQGVPGKDGHTPVITIVDGYWYIDGVNTNILAVGAKGEDGKDGVTPQLRINSDNIWEVSYDNGATWESLGISAVGQNGSNGTNGVTPKLRVNSKNVWEVSYDNGATWESLGISAVGTNGTNGANGKDGADGKDGKDGVDGKDGITPKLRINDDNIWEVSYDNGQTWESLGVSASGADGVTPQLRINGDTNMWEVSYDNGETWTSMGVVATGANGKDGGSILPIIISCISLAGMVIMFCIMMADRKKKAYVGK